MTAAARTPVAAPPPGPARGTGASRTHARVRTAHLPAPDGTPLATDICLPATPGPHPAVLIRTPYDRRAHRPELRGWAARGFAALAQDVRGRHGSPGTWRPYHGEAADGAPTVRWVRSQPWSDGRLLAAGASYAAHCALALALDPDPTGGPSGPGTPDAVLVAVPALDTAHTAREPSGPERLLGRAGWWAAHGDRPDSDENALARALDADPALLHHLPLTTLPDRLARPLPSWPGVWSPTRRGRLLDAAPTARVPLLAVGGTHDPFAAETVTLWRRWTGAPARLLLGPWGHRLTADPGADAHPKHRLPLGEAYVSWARAALDGRLDAAPRGAVGLGGSPLWLPAPAHPGEPSARYGFGRPTGLRLLGAAHFTADPRHPVRSDDLAVPRPPGPRSGDAHPDASADRCLLVTAPLPRPLDLLGTARVRLRACADTPCADWVARLVALAPDGAAAPLATGVVRRHDPPGRPADLSVPLGPLARRLPAGTRLRLEIAGHHFPAHARNPHTGEDPVTATVLHPSRRTLRTEHCALLLPVSRTCGFTAAVDPLQEISR
ncbi:CocE/NonD family hydrolase [Streptomyces sp. JJ66]|uniref:CocE/NonD family hydrolase n=1 Tax=Streptomyces sp. JJ66 TaxID=2803843 RepID=UPI001C57BEEB|nr:CocE/NonD family hydrolase [Streptomyces sp. JJ66]MBW1600643.1 CocE/NonD family hydrolase [Streptomyces sp. JJ66]